jgi:outer membrane protein TolC
MIIKSKRNLAVAAGLVAATTLSGCTVGPDFKRPGWASPGSWFSGPKEAVKRPASIPVAEPIDADWWTLFHDPVLTGLERRVAAENLDVKVAEVRLAESRAQLGVARSSLFPTLGGNASYVRQQASNNGIFAIIPSAAGASGANGRLATQPAG